MSTVTRITADEYLATSWRPDREFVDGQLIERNLGEYDHSNLQATLAIWFGPRRREWNIRVLTEPRMRVSASRFRIPDVVVIPRDRAIEPILTKAPLICIEILSRDDTLRSMQDRVDDYLAFGVPNIWILDPASLRAYICTREGFYEAQSRVLEAVGSPVRVPLDELFAELD